MLRTLAVLAIAGVVLALIGMGGKIGPLDMTHVPPAMIGFAAVSALVLIGLRRI
jgi:hypothetical protein